MTGTVIRKRDRLRRVATKPRNTMTLRLINARILSASTALIFYKAVRTIELQPICNCSCQSSLFNVYC
eukprot:scaffold487048_cov15-Prasinocladus_malaysianus.AAC.1